MLDQHYHNSRLMLGQCLAIGQMLGMGSHSRDLGMNSQSFLFKLNFVVNARYGSSVRGILRLGVQNKTVLVVKTHGI